MKFLHERRRKGDVQFEALSAITQIGAALEVDFAVPAFLSKFPFRPLL